MLPFLRSSTFRNFTWLVINHSANALWPLLLYPFLVRSVGMERFGEFSLMLSVLNIALIFIDYGFQITGVKDVVNAGSNKELNHVFSSIFMLKTCLLAMMLVVLVPVVILLFKTNSRLHVYMGLFIAIGGNLFNPIWLLLAKNKVHIVAIPNLILRVAIVLLVLRFIHSPADFWLIYYFTGATYFLFGMLGFVYVLYAYKLQINLVSMAVLKNELRKGRSLFVSSLSIGFYSQVPVLVLGVICGNAVVGEYAIAEKFIMLLRQLLNVFAQSLFPAACKKAKLGFEQVRQLYWQIMPSLLGGFLITGILLVLLAPFIIQVATGGSHPQAVMVFRILVWLPLIAAAIVPFYHTMLIYEMKWQQGIIFVLATVVALLFNTFFTWLAASTGAAVAVLCTELYIFICMVRVVQRSPYPLINVKTKLEHRA